MEKQFNEWLRENRHAKGLSRDELAAACGISNTWIARLEQGVKTPSPKMKVRLENFFQKPNDITIPDWMWEKLTLVAHDLGTTPGAVINVLIYDFIKKDKS